MEVVERSSICSGGELMYGSIFNMKVKVGQEQKLVDMFQKWEKERKPKVKGAVASYVLRPDTRPGELIGVAVFTDKSSYIANANDPAQDKWYQEMKKLLVADPQWQDGEYVLASAAK
jgi:hypothetical protein